MTGKCWIGVVTMVIVTLMGGCAGTARERASVLRFAGATRTLAVSAGAVFERDREETITMTQFVLDAGDPLGIGVRADDPDRAIDAPDLAARLDTLDRLDAYAQTMALLIAGEPGALASDRELDDTLALVGVTDDDAMRVLTIVRGVGGVISDARRAEAVRALVNAMGEVIDAVCVALERDLDVMGGGFATQVLIARSDAVSAARDTGQAMPSFRDDTTRDGVRGAVRALRAAHLDMLASARAGDALSVDSVEAFAHAVRDAVVLVQGEEGGAQ